jgi:cysteine-S-conjugate beta-lyase
MMPTHTAAPSGPELYDFDAVIDRRHSDSGKWNRYAEDVLPMWVADMDFASPPPILAALHARVDHAVFGYGGNSAELSDLICARMDALYGWHITPDQVVLLPGLVSGLNIVARAIGAAGTGVMVNTPVYPPFLSAPINHDRVLNNVPLAITHRHDGQGRAYLHWEMDFPAMQAGLDPQTRLFMLCNPHNPVGRAYDRAELEQLAEFCLRNKLVICSDEIHSDLLMGETRHIPLAALSPEIAAQTITLHAPSKTFNVPGLGCSYAIVPNPELRRQVEAAMSGIVPHVNLLGITAAVAAYAECDEWLTQLCSYLTANRDYLFDYVTTKWPAVELTLPEATYLGWLDFNKSAVENPYAFFLEHAKVALGDGSAFGSGGEGFVRLNFGCPRALLVESLERMSEALEQANT